MDRLSLFWLKICLNPTVLAGKNTKCKELSLAGSQRSWQRTIATIFTVTYKSGWSDREMACLCSPKFSGRRQSLSLFKKSLEFLAKSNRPHFSASAAPLDGGAFVFFTIGHYQSHRDSGKPEKLRLKTLIFLRSSRILTRIGLWKAVDYHVSKLICIRDVHRFCGFLILSFDFLILFCEFWKWYT